MIDKKFWLKASSWTLEEACVICHGKIPPIIDSFNNDDIFSIFGLSHSWNIKEVISDKKTVKSIEMMKALAQRALSVKELQGDPFAINPVNFVAWAVRMDCFGLPDYILEHFGCGENKSSEDDAGSKIDKLNQEEIVDIDLKYPITGKYLELKKKIRALALQAQTKMPEITRPEFVEMYSKKIKEIFEEGGQELFKNMGRTIKSWLKEMNLLQPGEKGRLKTNT